MDFKVEFTAGFIEDLEEIVRHVAQENPDAALRLGERIIEAGETLNFFPHRHPRVRLRPELRRVIVNDHFKVFYRIRPATKTVQILRCWDGRRGADPV